MAERNLPYEGSELRYVEFAPDGGKAGGERMPVEKYYTSPAP